MSSQSGCDEEEDEQEGTRSPSSPEGPSTPPTRKRKCVMQGSRPTRLRRTSTLVTKTAENRIRLCVLVVDGGLSLKAACDVLGVSRSSMLKCKWVERYKEGGMDALLEDNRTHKKVKMTPRTGKVVRDCARRGENASEIRMHVQESYRARGDAERDPPSVRTIQNDLHDNFKYVTKRRTFLIKTPWHARYVY